MCLIIGSLALAPRIMAVLWWAIAPRRWEETFPFALVAVLGIIFLPWTTLALVIVWPGGTGPSEWLLIAFAFVGDLATHGTSRVLLRPFSPRQQPRPGPS
jgi:hypothetical protein